MPGLVWCFKLLTKMNGNIVLIISILNFFSSFAQSIDFKHKSIFIELKEITKIENPVLSKIPVPDSILSQNAIHGNYFFVKTPNTDSLLNYIYIGRVNSCRTGGCTTANKPINNETSEYFDYFIVFHHNLSIKIIKVFNYQATHGQEIRLKGWLRQFAGFNGNNNLIVGKNIDGISGATNSVHGITSDIESKTRFLKTIIN